MREWFHVFVWKHTGWVCPDWNRRDNDALHRYWCALVDAKYALMGDDSPTARQALWIINEGLR